MAEKLQDFVELIIPDQTDRSFVSGLNPELFSNPPLPFGIVHLDLAPRAAPRMNDYSWAKELNPSLYSNPPLPAGVEVLDVPASRLRLNEYSWNDSGVALRSNPPLPAGAKVLDVPSPRLRLNEYSWTTGNPPLFNAPPLPSGAQVTIVPSPIPRMADYAWSRSILPLFSAPPLPAGRQVSEKAQPAPAPLNVSVSFFWLPITTTVFNMPPYGGIWTEVPRGASKYQASFVSGLNPALFSHPPRPAGVQVTDVPRAAPMLADRSAVWFFYSVPVQSLPFGSQWTAAAPLALARMDQSFVQSIPVALYRNPPLPAGVTIFETVRAAKRLNDYGWTDNGVALKSNPPLPAGMQEWKPAPPSALRMNEYSWTQAARALYSNPPMPAGQQLTGYTYPAPRMKEYSFTDTWMSRMFFPFVPLAVVAWTLANPRRRRLYMLNIFGRLLTFSNSSIRKLIKKRLS